MTAQTPPRTALVFDVNVFIDAVDTKSRYHEDAQRALANENQVPAFISHTMLQTIASKLYELGGEAATIEEYVDLIVTPQHEDGLGIEVIQDVALKDYGIQDSRGNTDYEDSTVVSLMDAAEHTEHCPAVLITNDHALTQWCSTHNRVAMSPKQIPWRYGLDTDALRLASLQYLARRVFQPVKAPTPELLPRSPEEKARISQIVQNAVANIGFPDEYREARADFDAGMTRLRHVVDTWNPHNELMKPRIELWEKNLAGLHERAAQLDDTVRQDPETASNALSDLRSLHAKVEKALDAFDTERTAPVRVLGAAHARSEHPKPPAAAPLESEKQPEL